MQKVLKFKNVILPQMCIMFVLVLWFIGSLFCSLPVHAAEVSEAEISGLKMYSLIGSCDYVLGDGANAKDYPDFPMFNVNPDPTVFYVSDDVYVSYVQSNDWKSKNISNAPLTYAFVSTENFTIIRKTNGKFFKQSPSKYQVNGNDLYFFRASFSNGIGQNGQVNAGDIYVANLRVNHSVYFYNNDIEMWSYLYSVAKDKIDTSINDIDISTKDHFDSAYSLTGFTANNKINASWTGTTQRSNMTDIDVNEYVRVAYAYAPKDDPDNIGEFTQLDTDYSTSAKSLTVALSDLAPSDDSKFVRQVNIIPYYSDSDGPFGNYYYGNQVCVYFDKNGKIESIVQNSVPTDGEVIGNNISLIGFRYDTSFHAEFVDVWSNAVNCSAFDLGGSQYLSLGVKVLYYNGQSKDIDFVSLNRKNLVWDKTFDSFKTFNGSGIKQLFFTPYIKTGINNPWNKGNSIVIDFDVNGNATSSFDTGDDGTVHLSDFKLTGVVWNKPMLAYGTITWTGTTANSDMSIVPDSDTLVVCSYPVYDSSLNESYETYDTVTIGKGSIRVYIDSLIDKYTNAGKTWNGEMWLTPCYKKGGVLYMGEPVIVNCTKGTVSDIEVDESTGTANQIDKTDENKSYADAVLSSGNNFFSIVKGLIASMQQLPELIATLFSFLPGWVNALIAGSIFVIFVCRILGR